MVNPSSPTYRLGLIGHPVEHSWSPTIHHSLLAGCKLNGHYQLEAVRPEALPAFLANDSQAFDGLNVTVPHKQTVFEWLSHHGTIAPSAQPFNAVNTLVKKPNGQWIGHNTDGLGFFRSLPTQLQDSLADQVVTVLGAGGSAQAVTITLVQRGAKTVQLVVRSPHKAEHLAKQCESLGASVSVYSLHEANTALSRTTLLIQTTPVGLWPQTNRAPLTEEQVALLPPQCFVADLIYRPHTTQLMQFAQARQLATLNGLGMLIYQGVAAFELWTDRTISEAQILPIVDKLTALT